MIELSESKEVWTRVFVSSLEGAAFSEFTSTTALRAAVRNAKEVADEALEQYTKRWEQEQ